MAKVEYKELLFSELMISITALGCFANARNDEILVCSLKMAKVEYKALLFSELMISIMEDDDISIRELAKEADISPSVIQDLRSGKQYDIKVSNLVKIAHAFGYEVILQKGKKRLTFQERVKNSKNHLSVIAAAS
jgi:DNA-binding Xre family transcriptional regulator